jgi:predicted nucleotidyltransferase
VYAHHAETIQRVVDHFRGDVELEALLLGGSVAHGFERPDSDVDVMFVISDESHAARNRMGKLVYSSSELCVAPTAYVDGKYLTAAMLRAVAEKGSEPARFAFQDSRVLFSRLDGLEAMLARIVRYPLEAKAERMMRFAAQLEAWNWYASEALKHENPYLLGVSVDKLVLFGGRLILAHNELLYPYHKWFLRVLEVAPDQPAGLMPAIRALYVDPSVEAIGRFYELVKGFRDWDSSGVFWPVQFMADSELNWLNGPAPVDDL